jgi:hypothetical protein
MNWTNSFITWREPNISNHVLQFLCYSVSFCVYSLQRERAYRTIAQQWIVPCLFVAAGTYVWRAIVGPLVVDIKGLEKWAFCCKFGKRDTWLKERVRDRVEENFGVTTKEIKCCANEHLESADWTVAVPVPFTWSPSSQACWLSSTRDSMSIVRSTVLWVSLSLVSALCRRDRFWQRLHHKFSQQTPVGRWQSSWCAPVQTPAAVEH